MWNIKTKLVCLWGRVANFSTLKQAAALGCLLFKKSNGLILGDVGSSQSTGSNLLSSVEKAESWKETERGFVPGLKTRDAGLEVI